MAVIGLVACVKSKLETAAPARELYTSPLFRKSRAYILAHSDRWYILSAKYGLLDPNEVIHPYEMTLKTMPKRQKDIWAHQVLTKLLNLTTPADTIIFLAGLEYRKGLIPALQHRGNSIQIPMEGIPFGNQLAWLTEHTGV